MIRWYLHILHRTLERWFRRLDCQKDESAFPPALRPGRCLRQLRRQGEAMGWEGWGMRGVRLFFRPIWIHLITLSFFRELSWTFLQWKIERERERERERENSADVSNSSDPRASDTLYVGIFARVANDLVRSSWRHGGLHKFWYPWVAQNGTIYLNGHMYIYIYIHISLYIYI